MKRGYIFIICLTMNASIFAVDWHQKFERIKTVVKGCLLFAACRIICPSIYPVRRSVNELLQEQNKVLFTRIFDDRRINAMITKNYNNLDQLLIEDTNKAIAHLDIAKEMLIDDLHETRVHPGKDAIKKFNKAHEHFKSIFTEVSSIEALNHADDNLCQEIHKISSLINNPFKRFPLQIRQSLRRSTAACWAAIFLGGYTTFQGIKFLSFYKTFKKPINT